jgi:hypothetical protein
MTKTMMKSKKLRKFVMIGCMRGQGDAYTESLVGPENDRQKRRQQNAMVAGAGPVQSMYFCELKKSIGPNLPQAVWGYFVLCNILKHGGIFHRILHRIFYGIKLVLRSSLQKSGDQFGTMK